MDAVCSKLRVDASRFLRYPISDAEWQNLGVDIRDRIRAIIAERPDLTPRKVSLSAGLSDSALHKFLSGATDSITLKTVDKLAAALDVDPRWLAYGEGSPEMASDISALLNRIPDDQRRQALRVLEAFARTGTEG